MAVARGVGIARGADGVPLAYFDAVASTPEEAAEMEYQTNSDRELARIKARHGAT